MKLNSVVKVLLIGLCCSALADDVSIEKCPSGDSKCIEKVANEIFKESPSGVKELNLGVLDPLAVSDVEVKTSGNSPISLEIKLRDLKLYGFTGATVTEVNGFNNDMSGVSSMIIKSKVNSLVGNYEMNGKFLVLPITGKGPCNITLVNPTFTASFKGEPDIIDGKTFLKIKDFKLKMEVKQVINNYENLFNDKILSDNMNALLNENWKDFHNAASPPVVKSIGKDIKNVLSKMFETKPYEGFFV